MTDKTGKRVTDLKPEEVELSEDGQVRTITNFAYVNIDSSSSRPVVRASNPNTRDTSAPPLVPRPVRPGQVRRTIALVVDDLGLSFESSVKVRKSLQKFLDEQLQPDDLVAIIRTSGGIGALQSFTTDRRQLYAAVEKVKWNLIGRGEVSTFMSTAGMLRKDNPRENVSTVDSIDADKHLQQMRRDMFTVGTLGALHYVIKGLQPLPGRKAIVLFSDGFKIGPGGFFENNQSHILRELTDFAIAPQLLSTLSMLADWRRSGLLRRFDERLQQQPGCFTTCGAEQFADRYPTRPGFSFRFHRRSSDPQQ